MFVTSYKPLSEVTSYDFNNKLEEQARSTLIHSTPSVIQDVPRIEMKEEIEVVATNTNNESLLFMYEVIWKSASKLQLKWSSRYSIIQ